MKYLDKSFTVSTTIRKTPCCADCGKEKYVYYSTQIGLLCPYCYNARQIKYGKIQPGMAEQAAKA